MVRCITHKWLRLFVKPLIFPHRNFAVFLDKSHSHKASTESVEGKTRFSLFLWNLFFTVLSNPFQTRRNVPTGDELWRHFCLFQWQLYKLIFFSHFRLYGFRFEKISNAIEYIWKKKKKKMTDVTIWAAKRSVESFTIWSKVIYIFTACFYVSELMEFCSPSLRGFPRLGKGPSTRIPLVDFHKMKNLIGT